MSTKERILNEALMLFAENGYSATSMGMLAERVGIKAPSLYKHYKGKEDILNSLIDAAEARYEENFASERRPEPVPDSLEEYINETMKRVRFTISDPMIKNVRKFLVQEQFRNKRLADITSKHQLDGIMLMYKNTLDEMMKRGIIRQGDSHLLSLELTGPVTVLVAKTDREPAFEEEALRLIEKHLRHFFAALESA